ncbi:MAG: glycosyltransferase [Candidatus Aminicenantes bacterium]|nr:glycosyltransferase [Candidatus Aminicenantes bacterium]
MKIVLDTIPLIYGTGAAYRTTCNLYQELLRLDKKNEYVFLHIGRHLQRLPYSAILDENQIPVRKVFSPIRLIRWTWNSLSWPKLEQITGDIDLYHVAGIIAPATRRAKVLVTIRGIATEVIPELLPPERVKSLRKVLRNAMARADYYLAVSETTKKDMMKHLGVNSDIIYVVPHGVDPVFRYLTDRESLSARLKRAFNIVRPYFLYVGAIGRHKNVMGILQAYRLLRDKGHANHDLLLVGPSDSASQEARDFIRKNNLQDWVIMTGQLKQDTQELTDLYNGADCFLFPSYYEGWCSPPLEAMACGTPVVASSCSSIPETVGEAALLADPDDPQALADKTSLLLEDKDLRAQFIEKGLQRAAELNWRASALQLIEVYKKIEDQML